MWTAENRKTYDRKAARYPSDLIDEEWVLIEPHLPPPRSTRRHKVPDRREIVNAIFYILTTGCQWRQLPKDFPSKSTVHDYMICWDRDGVLTRLHDALYTQARELAGRNAEPTLVIVDSQSVKSAEKGGLISIHQGTMQVRKSRARSVILRSTRKDSSSISRSRRPTSRTAMPSRP
jgi:transposase